MTNARPWYSIRNASPGVAEVYLYEQIGYDFWSGDGTTAKQFLADLRAIGAPQIDLHVNSPGGAVFDGQTIYNGLRNHPSQVTTYIDGLAASIASVIALAGDRVVMAENALFMIHDPWSGCAGTAEDMRREADVLDKVKETIVTVYERSGQDRSAIAQAMAEETWYTAEEALAAGLIDEIVGAQQIAASLDLSGLPYRNAVRVAAGRAQERLDAEAHDRLGEVLADPEPAASVDVSIPVSGSGGAPDRGLPGGAPTLRDVPMQAARLTYQHRKG